MLFKTIRSITKKRLIWRYFGGFHISIFFTVLNMIVQSIILIISSR